jgi:hypothetical protein
MFLKHCINFSLWKFAAEVKESEIPDVSIAHDAISIVANEAGQVPLLLFGRRVIRLAPGSAIFRRHWNGMRLIFRPRGRCRDLRCAHPSTARSRGRAFTNTLSVFNEIRTFSVESTFQYLLLTGGLPRWTPPSAPSLQSRVSCGSEGRFRWKERSTCLVTCQCNHFWTLIRPMTFLFSDKPKRAVT